MGCAQAPSSVSSTPHLPSPCVRRFLCCSFLPFVYPAFVYPFLPFPDTTARNGKEATAPVSLPPCCPRWGQGKWQGQDKRKEQEQEQG